MASKADRRAAHKSRVIRRRVGTMLNIAKAYAVLRRAGFADEQAFAEWMGEGRTEDELNERFSFLTHVPTLAETRQWLSEAQPSE